MLGIEALQRKPVNNMKIELVERKGVGHPDYIIDASCEYVSRELSKYYLNKYGMILHHNVDKGLIIGGEAEPRFGGGVVTKPIEIHVAGRASYDDDYEEVIEVSREAVKKFLKENIRHLDPDTHVNIKLSLRRGSTELANLVKRSKEIPLANDTSFGVGYYPLSDLESMVYYLERHLNSPEIKKSYKFIGEDIKISGLRIGRKVTLTVASAIVDRYINSVKEYKDSKDTVLKLSQEFLDQEGYSDKYRIRVRVNTADDLKSRKIYLTVTGTSAEMGDDGNTGRGNRVNGLITPNRFMSLEAVAGKNPINHVGKIYNVLAMKMSRDIYMELEDTVEEVYVRILSTIGKKITEPQIVNVLYVPKRGAGMKTREIKSVIKRVVDENMTGEAFHKLTNDIVEGKYTLF